MATFHALLYPVYVAMNYLAYHAEWLAAVVFVVSTINWARHGRGEQYTAAWWAAAILLGLLALARP